MKEVNIKNIIEKYKSGNSTLEEESYLFDHIDESETDITTLSTFVKCHKKEFPENFNTTMWNEFEKKITKKNRFKIGMLSAAASIILLVSILSRNQGQSYEEKQMLLNESLNMLADADKEEKKQDVIYESDLIIIYTVNE